MSFSLLRAGIAGVAAAGEELGLHVRVRQAEVLGIEDVGHARAATGPEDRGSRSGVRGSRKPGSGATRRLAWRSRLRRFRRRAAVGAAAAGLRQLRREALADLPVSSPPRRRAPRPSRGPRSSVPSPARRRPGLSEIARRDPRRNRRFRHTGPWWRIDRPVSRSWVLRKGQKPQLHQGDEQERKTKRSSAQFSPMRHNMECDAGRQNLQNVQVRELPQHARSHGRSGCR